MVQRRRLAMPLLLWWTVVDFASATRYDHVLSPRIPRGGGVESEKRSATDNIEDILLVDEEGPYDDATNPEYYMHHRRRIRQKLPLPKRLLNVARNFIGRTADIILKPKRRPRSSDEVDHTFDELDRILENNTNNTATGNILQEEEWIEETWPPLPSQRRKWWKERSLRLWIKQMEHKFVSKETATALRTIGNIIDAFPDYGVVDLFAMYSPKDVIWSIVALSRLQRVLEPDLDDVDEDDSNIITDRQLLEELAHYCSFANAAYGWKGLPFCGRLHLGGDNHVLIRSTGIRRRDIVATNWHAKANRPAYYIVRDRKRKAIVLGIRGTASPRDIVTDLCASAENFLVEDGPEIREIGEEEDSDVSTATPPLIVGRAHKGMVDGAKSVARVTGKVVSNELDAHPDYSLVIVGHSLGGGIACVLGALWSRRFENRVRSIAYGSPCVFPLNNTRAFESVCISVMGERDPFATISLGHIADISKALSKLCQDKGFRDEILRRTGLGLLVNPLDTAADNYEWCASAMVALRKQMDSEKLLPPGQILHMTGPLIDLSDFQTDGNNSSRIGLKSVDVTNFNELKLHARMLDVSFHIPLRYETILRRLAMS